MTIIRKPANSISIITRDKEVMAALDHPEILDKFASQAPPIVISSIRRFKSSTGYKLYCTKDTATTILRGEVTLPFSGKFRVAPTRYFCACSIAMKGDEDISVISAVFRHALGDGDEDVFADRVLAQGVVRVITHSPESWMRVRSFNAFSVDLGEKNFVLTGCDFPRRNDAGDSNSVLERKVMELEREQKRVSKECTGLGERMNELETKLEKGLSGLRDSLIEIERRNDDRMERMRVVQENRDIEYEKKLIRMNDSFEAKMQLAYNRMTDQLTRYLDRADQGRSSGES